MFRKEILNFLRVVRYLRSAGIAMSSKMISLHEAIEKNFDSLVLHLLEDKNDIKILDESGQSILHFALSCNVSSLMIWEYLVRYGANVNALDKHTRHSKSSLLHLAADHQRTGMLDIMKLLIKHGANVDAVDATGATPIFYSIKDKFARTASKTAVLLLEAGANVNAKDASGKTPLHYACQIGNIHNIKILLKYGADINLRCSNDMLPTENLNSTITDPFDVLRLIYQQSMFLHLAGLYLDEYFRRELTSSDYSDRQAENFAVSTVEKGSKELNDLKKKYIACNLTFYSLLTKSSHELAIYKRNPVINKIIKSIDLVEVYPIYGGIILRNLVAASTRMKLIEEAEKRDIYRVFPEIPIEMIDHIFKFLNNDDFFTLIQAL